MPQAYDAFFDLIQCPNGPGLLRLKDFRVLMTKNAPGTDLVTKFYQFYFDPSDNTGAAQATPTIIASNMRMLI